MTKDISPYAIAVGIPATIIKYRFDDMTIEKLMQIDFDKISIDEIKNNRSLFEEQMNGSILTQLMAKYEIDK